MRTHLTDCPKKTDKNAPNCTCFERLDANARNIVELLDAARDLSDEQFVSNGLNIVLEDLMLERGLCVEDADRLMRRVLAQLIEDTRC